MPRRPTQPAPTTGAFWQSCDAKRRFASAGAPSDQTPGPSPDVLDELRPASLRVWEITPALPTTVERAKVTSSPCLKAGAALAFRSCCTPGHGPVLHAVEQRVHPWPQVRALLVMVEHARSFALVPD